MDQAIIDRFWKSVREGETPGHCWTWLKSVDPNGYPQMHRTESGRTFSLKGHRVSWEIHRGALGPGEKLAQTCGDRACTNPAHLLVVTPDVRASRSRARIQRQVESSIVPGALDDCWPWRGTTRNGYGYVTDHGNGRCVHVYAHRRVYETATGTTLPKGAVVRHTCDNRLCCNPAHLVPGSPYDNVRDCVARGRNARGERSPQARLREADVRAILQAYREGVRIVDLAREHGVHKTTISDVVHGRTWRSTYECK